MRLIHYSKEPLKSVYSIPLAQQSERRSGLHKPRGLWVSVEGENDWKEWYEGEGWGLEGLACATEITLAPNANILRVEGEDALDRFHKEYSVVQYRYGDDLGVRTAITWPKVAKNFDGIVIAPYVYSRRLDEAVSDWYYGWDCASGCIWNADATASLNPIQISQAA
jgi:hypothetical protein